MRVGMIEKLFNLAAEPMQISPVSEIKRGRQMMSAMSDVAP
jgi:hypothetical protein